MDAVVPAKAPLLPAKAVGTLARFGFNILIVSLIYSTTAKSVSPSSISEYWILIVGAFVVIGLSYLVASLVGYVFRIHHNPRDFSALRIAATFPNIVALPILIFPSLCEYSVVHEGYFPDEELDSIELSQKCEATAQTMIFCYFFGWSLVFYTFGHPQLIAATKLPTTRGIQADTVEGPVEGPDEEASEKSALQLVWGAAKQTVSSPGFLAIAAGFLTGCIRPLQESLFEAGGSLRFLGSAVETLGMASSSMSTMVVAASLASSHLDAPEHPSETVDLEAEAVGEETEDRTAPLTMEFEDNPIMSDPNHGPLRRRRAKEFRQSFREQSRRISQILVPPKEVRRITTWFILSRLILTPSVVVGLLLAVECSRWSLGVSNLARLVLIINSCLPGALVVVVLLKSREELSQSAAAVASVYLPSYLLSIVTIAGWSAVGLLVTLPGDDGRAFCQG